MWRRNYVSLEKGKRMVGITLWLIAGLCSSFRSTKMSHPSASSCRVGTCYFFFFLGKFEVLMYQLLTRPRALSSLGRSIRFELIDHAILMGKKKNSKTHYWIQSNKICPNRSIGKSMNLWLVKSTHVKKFRCSSWTLLDLNSFGFVEKTRK